MTKQTINVQDGFLFQALKGGHQVLVELVSGRAVVGRLLRFDRFALILRSEDREVLVYKHAIATVGPVGDDADDSGDQGQ